MSMQRFKDDPLLFINLFLRFGDEPLVTEEQYAELSKGKPNIYDIRWQVRVRKVFFNA